jgi:ATP-dependent DNA helicase RecG
MNRTDLEEMLANGESSTVEFKTDELHPGSLAEEIVAFANTTGGTILLGVHDDGSVAGLTRNDIEEWIMNICSTNVIPEIIPEFYRFKINEEQYIIALRIPKGPHQPYRTSQGKFLIRIGTTKRLTSNVELARLFQSSSMMHYDITPVTTATVNDLDPDKIRAYFLHFKQIDPLPQEEKARLNMLTNADLIKRLEDGTFAPTVGGLLLFGKNLEQRLPAAGVTFARFEGSTIDTALLDKRELGGNLSEVVESTITAIEGHLPRTMELNGLRRLPGLPYPREVLREALVNAVVHRDYSISGSKVRVFLFADRLEVRSPGRLPNTVTVEKMKIGTSFARNPMLLRYMENLDYVDRLGRGIPMIIEQMVRKSGREPFLEEKGEEFWLVLFPPA